MTGELYINMTEQDRPISGSYPYLLKRWQKYTIFSKSGSYNRTNNPNENLYQSCSIYLYDYVVVSKEFYSRIVYTSSVVDNTGSLNRDWVSSQGGWQHYAGTMRNSPNSLTNDYVWRYNEKASLVVNRPIYGYAPEYYAIDDEYNRLMRNPLIINNNLYYEVVKGYPRNHLINRRDIFSLFRVRSIKNTNSSETYHMYVRNRQDNSTTIGESGITDGSEPIQSFNVGNVTLYKTDNVINA